MVHLVDYKLDDLTALLSSLGRRRTPFPLPHTAADEGHRGPNGPDPRGPRPAQHIYILDLHIDMLKQKPRDLR